MSNSWTSPRASNNATTDDQTSTSTSSTSQPQVTPSTGHRIGPTGSDAVSLDSRPIVIPMVSAMFGFPVLALAVICVLRYRARRARLKSHLKRARNAGCVVYRAGHGHRKDFGKARLKVMRDPPTFTELSVIGSRGPSSSSDESSAAGLQNFNYQHHLQRPILMENNSGVNNNNINSAFTRTSSRLEIAAGDLHDAKNDISENKCCDLERTSRLKQITCNNGKEEEEGVHESNYSDSEDSQNRFGFTASPLEILTGSTGLEFTYTVVDGS